MAGPNSNPKREQFHGFLSSMKPNLNSQWKQLSSGLLRRVIVWYEFTDVSEVPG
jgi:hypothetical protein